MDALEKFIEENLQEIIRERKDLMNLTSRQIVCRLLVSHGNIDFPRGMSYSFNMLYATVNIPYVIRRFVTDEFGVKLLNSDGE